MNSGMRCLVLATLLLASCVAEDDLGFEVTNPGEDGEYNDDPTEPVDMGEPEELEDPEEIILDGTIYSILNESDIFSMFFDAVKAAHLDAVLYREKVTLLAPTNEAINKYGGKRWNQTVDGAKKNIADYYGLRRIIMHHVIQPKLISRASIPHGSSLVARTMSGYKILFSHTRSKLFAEIFIGSNRTEVELSHEYNTTNGFIHQSEEMFFDTMDVIGGGTQLVPGMLVLILSGSWILLRL